jgi:hypothetical protein
MCSGLKQTLIFVILKKMSKVDNTCVHMEEHRLIVSEIEVLREISDSRKGNNTRRKKLIQ